MRETARMATELVGLVAGDDPVAWQRLGFAGMADGVVELGGIRIRVDGAGGGLREWVLRAPEPGPASIDGLTTRWTEQPPPRVGGDGHPNGAFEIDHLVVFTDDRERTAAQMEAIGGEVRRRAEPPDVRAPMAFVRIGSSIVEVAQVPGNAAGARFWGLVAVVPDVDVLAAELEGLVGAPKDAVQPGRRIVTVQREARLAVPMAFMSPRP